jgi:hypothetical protein
MVLVDENIQLSPRESVLMEHESEQAKLAREHAVRMKELEIQLAKDKYTAEIELKKLEARWSSWLRLPSTVIKLPVYIILAFGYLLDSVRGNEPSKDFWKLLK